MNNKNQKPDNGLCIKNIKSWVEEENKNRKIKKDELQNINQFIKDKFKTDTGTAVFYLNYGIRFANWVNSELKCQIEEKNISDHLLEARIFNDDRELKIWKASSGYYYRLRIDDENNENCEVIDANQNLWGTQTEPVGTNWTKLTEERGTELIIPLTVVAKKGDSKPLVYVKTRNYIDYTEYGQASFVDSRFIKIDKHSESKKE